MIEIPVIISLGKFIIDIYKNVNDNIEKILQKSKKKISDASREKRLKRAKEAIKDPNLYAFLEWKYGDEPILKRCGHTYPVAVYKAHSSQRDDVNSVLDLGILNEGPGEMIEKDDLEVCDEEFFKIVKGNFIFDPNEDRMKYTMNSLKTENELKITCDLGMHSLNYYSSESLEFELRNNIHKVKENNNEKFEIFFNELKLLKKLEGVTADPIRSGYGRSAVIGVSTLIAYNNTGELELLVMRRAKIGVPLRSGLNHVFPSFMFAPMNEIYFRQECSVKHNFYREYLQELFGIDTELNDPTKIFYDRKQIEYLMTLMENGGANLYFTGITVNLMNLRPEICLLLIITNPDWYEKWQRDPELRHKFSNEISSENLKDKEIQMGDIPFSTDDRMLKAGRLYPDKTVPAGAGAFWLGVDTIRDLERTGELIRSGGEISFMSKNKESGK